MLLPTPPCSAFCEIIETVLSLFVFKLKEQLSSPGLHKILLLKQCMHDVACEHVG